ncbi:hypothetical protein PINS_up021766 [Pythium insidiosum]|nr:hypothetical protein PINS_up021766 [Pythium insidiosum]
MVFSGAEIRKVSGVSNWQCCDECGKTAGCAAYSWVAATSECSLKWFAGSATAKNGVISGIVKDVMKPETCGKQEENVDYWGNDIRAVFGVTVTECCDECFKTDGCVGYSFVKPTYLGKWQLPSGCYLKWSTSGVQSKRGIVSAKLSSRLPPKQCAVQEEDIDYYGNDIKCLHAVTNAQCCEACAKTKGCRAYTYVKGYDVFGLWWSPSACYLKRSAAGRCTKKGMISGKVTGV